MQFDEVPARSHWPKFLKGQDRKNSVPCHNHSGQLGWIKLHAASKIRRLHSATCKGCSAQTAHLVLAEAMVR